MIQKLKKSRRTGENDRSERKNDRERRSDQARQNSRQNLESKNRDGRYVKILLIFVHFTVKYEYGGQTE